MQRALLSLAALTLAACGSTATSTGSDAGDAHQSGSHDASDGHTHASDAGHPMHSDAGAHKDAGEHTDAVAPSDAGHVCYANTDCVGGTCGYSMTVCDDGGCTTSPACPGFCAPYASLDGGFCLAPGPPACPPDSGTVCDPFGHTCIAPSSEIVAIVDGGSACGLGVANCAAGFFCYAPVFPNGGVCTPVAGDGGACDPGNPFGGCAGALVCAGYGSSFDAGACQPPAGAGGRCAGTPSGGALPPPGSSGCAAQELCLDGGCALLPSSGPCLDGQCNSDAGFCSSSNACTAWLANGATCSSANECASGLCASNTHQCVALLPNGAACTGGPYDCSGGLCVGDQAGCATGICNQSGFCADSLCPRPDGGG